MIDKLLKTLFAPQDIAPLVFFRVGFGALMLWEVWRYFHYDRIARYYVEPQFYFHYWGYHWLAPLHGDGMFWLFYGLGALSVLILLGAAYRVSIALFWLGFTYVFLLDKAQYLNHFYLISLISFLMVFIPSHRALSVDAWLRPSLRAGVAPTWALWTLRGQMAVVYVFGGIAKINADWLAGEPMRSWMADRTDFPLIGRWFTTEPMVYLFSYGGLLLDLLIVPFLLWRHTRLPALVLALGFHLANDRLFNIGIFPWLAIAATLIFLPPRVFRLGQVPAALNAPVPAPPRHTQRWILAGLALYFTVQVLLPLRHWLYSGNPSWTEEGHTLAWHMRLRAKSGEAFLYASSPSTGNLWQLPSEDFLSARQYEQMKDNPHMILRFAHWLADGLHTQGTPDAQIRAWSMVSLNSRAPQLLIDPTADLTQAQDNLLPADWILPLVQRPVPHAPIPALLVSRRYEGVVLLVNITEQPFSLDNFALQSDAYTLHAQDFGTQTLDAGECLLAHQRTADLGAVFVPCNERGSRVILPPTTQPLPPLVLRSHSAQTRCTGIVCVLTDAPRG